MGAARVGVDRAPAAPGAPAAPAPAGSASGSSARGVAYVSAFLVLANANAVFAGNLLQSVHPFTFLFWSFFASTGLFAAILVATGGARALAIDRGSLVPLAILNGTSAFNWVGYFFALRYIEPAIVSAVMGGLGPVSTILLDRVVRGRALPRRIYVPAAGILAGAAMLAWASLTGRSGLLEIAVSASVIGLTAACLAGVSQALNTVTTKRLADRGWTATRIMVHRFYLLLAVALLLSSTGPGLTFDGWSQAGLVGVATVLGVVAPLWPLQRGIILSEPFTVAAMLSLAPILTYLFQAFDDRMQWSLASAAGCLVVTAFTVHGARLMHKGDAR